MYRSFFSYEEEECYRSGRDDVNRHSIDHFRDPFSDRPCDLAYNQGVADQEAENRRHEEERQLEAEQERQAQERYWAEQRAIEEQQYYDAMYDEEDD